MPEHIAISGHPLVIGRPSRSHSHRKATSRLGEASLCAEHSAISRFFWVRRTEYPSGIRLGSHDRRQLQGFTSSLMITYNAGHEELRTPARIAWPVVCLHR